MTAPSDEKIREIADAAYVAYRNKCKDISYAVIQAAEMAAYVAVSNAGYAAGLKAAREEILEMYMPALTIAEARERFADAIAKLESEQNGQG